MDGFTIILSLSLFITFLYLLFSLALSAATMIAALNTVSNSPSTIRQKKERVEEEGRAGGGEREEEGKGRRKMAGMEEVE